MAKKKLSGELATHYEQRLRFRVKKAPFLLHITEWKDKPPPVLVIKERAEKFPVGKDGKPADEPVHQLVDRGAIAGDAQRRLLPLISDIAAQVRSEDGVPLGLERFMTTEGLNLRERLPLDEETGAKLALMFKLAERVVDLDRTELIARRIMRFTREEAAYWLSRMTRFDAVANRWAIAGLRLMLGGSERKETAAMLKKLKV